MIIYKDYDTTNLLFNEPCEVDGVGTIYPVSLKDYKKLRKYSHYLTFSREYLGIGNDIGLLYALIIAVSRAKCNDIKNLENIIDKYMGEAKGIDSFIIPGTSLASAHLHIARTICRRAERIIISLSKIEEVNPMLIKYINRLSDALYAIARYSEDKLIPMEF